MFTSLLLTILAPLAFASTPEQQLTAQPWCAHFSLCDTMKALGHKCTGEPDEKTPVIMYKIALSQNAAGSKSFTYKSYDLKKNQEVMSYGGAWNMANGQIELFVLLANGPLQPTPEELADPEFRKALEDLAVKIKADLKGDQLTIYNPDNNTPTIFSKCQ